MKITEMQYASLVISLSTLGQTSLAENEAEGLRTLEYLLEAALANVRRALSDQDEEKEPRDFVAEAHERIAHKNDEEAPDWKA